MVSRQNMLVINLYGLLETPQSILFLTTQVTGQYFFNIANLKIVKMKFQNTNDHNAKCFCAVGRKVVL